MNSKAKELLLQARSLKAEFKQSGEHHYIDKAITLSREALEHCTPGDPQRHNCLIELANHLRDLYNQLGRIEGLDEATLVDREALALCPPGHPDRSKPLSNLAADLRALYKQLGKLDVLDEAILLDQEALTLRPPGHTDRSMSLNNLAVSLKDRYKQLGRAEDLDMSIRLDREALALRPSGHLDRWMSLNNLAFDLSMQYDQLGGVDVLNEAIILNREAISLCQPGHPSRSLSLSNLAGDLGTRYRRLGKADDLDEAILLEREAITLRPPGHPDRSLPLNNLGVDLSTRFKQLARMDDLDEAILLDREALTLRPLGHPDRSMSLINLGADLKARYMQLERVEDLNEAILLDREAIALRPSGHPGRWMSLNNLAVDLSSRYDQLGRLEDLDEAIVLDREAVALQPSGHPGRSMSLNNLALDLSTRYDQLGRVEDLDEAILLIRETLMLRPLGHPDRSSSLRNLAANLQTRYELLHCLQDQEEIFSLYTELAYVTDAVSSDDLSAAKAWIKASEHFHHSMILLAYETALRLLTQHLAAFPSLPQDLSQLKSLTSSLAADAFSACLRNHSPASAVELLEQARGVFWSQLTRLRSPLDDLIACGPAGNTLAEDFLHLTSVIRNAFQSYNPGQADHIWRLNLKLQQVVSNIRRLPGLSRFLLPSLFSDLRHAARYGPVIILNASEYGCDTLIVFADRDPVHIPLSITKDNVREMALGLETMTAFGKRLDITKDLCIFLRDLWDRAVSHIAEFLLTACPRHSRIWWCPTAEFSVLPLHAAGPYRRGQRNFADLFISSYTPTLSALIRARQPDSPASIQDGKRFIAIGQANAAGESRLPSVETELVNIGQCVAGLATFTRVEGEDSCISRVIEELSKTEWVHIACHGLAKSKQPFESAFALYDGHLTIHRLIGCELKNPEFAYLSACHTTVGDEESPDEMIHLASAMQFAGFCSVIGTMWQVDDAATNKITSVFYKQMVNEQGRLDHTRAAFALWKTMRMVDIPFDQRILYVHIGA